MNHSQRRLERLQREVERRRRARGGDELVEVMPLPYRLYELDNAGRRVYAEPDEDELALDEKIHQLIHGRG